MKRLLVLTEIIAPYRIPVFNALAKHEGIDLHVIFLAKTDPTMREWTVYTNEMQFSYEVLPSWRRHLGGCNLLLNCGLARALRRFSPEVILCGGYNYIASWQCLFWARRNCVPFFVWLESTAKDQRGGHFITEVLKAKFIRHCDGSVVPGKDSFAYVRSYGMPEENIFIAPNAVDNDLFARGAETAQKNAIALRHALQLPSRYFLFVGRLVPEKGVFDLLEAYGTLAPQLRKEIGLVFVGDGISKTDLVRRVLTTAPGDVWFAGFVQREELVNYYGLAEVFVFPTHSDTWGLVVNEAMACGLPIISSSVAGCVADLVEEHWNGRIVVQRNPRELARAMAELASSANVRATMGQRSRQRILQNSPEACAEGIAKAALSCGVLGRG